MIRIIDNKKVFMINDEYTMYKNICRSYDRPNFRGEELFKGHFEVNENGIIVFVRPPATKYSSLEVYCFLVSIMTNQHMRLMHQQVEAFVKEASDKYESFFVENNKKIAELVATVNLLKEKQSIEKQSQES